MDNIIAWNNKKIIDTLETYQLLEHVVFNRTRFSLLILAFCGLVHRYYTFSLTLMHM